MRNRKVYRAHRFSWEMANNKKIPAGMLVCHTCDTPLCVRPDHLFLGTNLDNIRDRTLKGRSAKGARHHKAKLTEQDVLQIRKRFLGKRGQLAALAREYGVCPQNMKAVVAGRTWRHLLEYK